MFRRLLSSVIFRILLGSSAVVTQGYVEQPIEQTKFVDIRNYLGNDIPEGEREKNPNKANGVIGHHTATPPSWDIMRVSDFQRFERDWLIISYDIGVSKSGVLYLCKDFDLLGYHASGWNLDSFAIFMLGNFSEEPPPKKMKKGFEKALKYLFDEYDLHYFMMHVTAKRIKQNLITECSGIYTYEWLGAFEFDDREWPYRIDELPEQPQIDFR